MPKAHIQNVADDTHLVRCPHCGSFHDAPDKSAMWTSKELREHAGVHECVECAGRFAVRAS